MVETNTYNPEKSNTLKVVCQIVYVFVISNFIIYVFNTDKGVYLVYK